MQPNEYVELVKKTESNDFRMISKNLIGYEIASYNPFIKNLRLIHASFGMNTEQAEFQDALKKYLFYGKEIDRINLLEELGDQLWYIAIAIDTLNSSFDEIMQMNINKLKKRYGVKFNEEGAIRRDLIAEKGALNKIQEDCIHKNIVNDKCTNCGLNVYKGKLI